MNTDNSQQDNELLDVRHEFSIKVKIDTTCILCNKTFSPGEEAIAKSPEGCTFCKQCHGKHPDKNVYDFKNKAEGWIHFTHTGKPANIIITKKLITGKI